MKVKDFLLKPRAPTIVDRLPLLLTTLKLPPLVYGSKPANIHH